MSDHERPRRPRRRSHDRETGEPLPETSRVRALFGALRFVATEERLLAAYLSDLCTLPEAQDFSNRWAAACLLEAGGSVRRVATDLAMSKETVERVNRWRKNGTGGYQYALAHLLPPITEAARQGSRKAKDDYYHLVLSAFKEPS